MHEDATTLAAELRLVPPDAAYRTSVSDALAARRRTLDVALAHLGHRAGVLAEVAERIIATLRSGHKVLVAGNGGSAAEAQHFAAELVGRFKRERAPYAALALTTDTSILTAVANDYGYREVFARQVCAIGQPGDLFVAFSTSGQSENLLCAAQAARAAGMATVAITGSRVSPLARLADATVRIPVTDTATVQELHMMATHILCDIVEAELAALERGDQK